MTRTLDSFPRDTVDRAHEVLGLQLGDREPTTAQLVAACLELEALDRGRRRRPGPRRAGRPGRPPLGVTACHP